MHLIYFDDTHSIQLLKSQIPKYFSRSQHIPFKTIEIQMQKIQKVFYIVKAAQILRIYVKVIQFSRTTQYASLPSSEVEEQMWRSYIDRNIVYMHIILRTGSTRTTRVQNFTRTMTIIFFSSQYLRNPKNIFYLLSVQLVFSFHYITTILKKIVVYSYRYCGFLKIHKESRIIK